MFEVADKKNVFKPKHLWLEVKKFSYQKGIEN